MVEQTIIAEALDHGGEGREVADLHAKVAGGFGIPSFQAFVQEKLRERDAGGRGSARLAA